MRFNVQVFGGVLPPPEVQEIAPMAMSAPTVTVGMGSKLGAPRHFVVYEGVELETRSPGSLSMFGPRLPDGSLPYIHVMENVWHVTFNLGYLEIEGTEVRPDGVVVQSRWEATPAGASPEDEALLRRVFGEE